MMNSLAYALAFFLVFLAWWISGRLLFPVSCPMKLVLPVQGDAEQTEQTLRALQRLTQGRLCRLELILLDQGLSEQGRKRCSCLAGEHGAELWTEEEFAAKGAEALGKP